MSPLGSVTPKNISLLVEAIALLVSLDSGYRCAIFVGMSSSLARLARALGGASPPEPLPSPPEHRNISPPSGTPKPVQASPRPPSAAATPSHARLLTHAGLTQSIRAWAATVDIDRRTLAYRVNHGWRVDEVLGFAQRPRDRAAEQAGSRATQDKTRVLVVDGDGKPIPRREAAAILGIQIRSLTHRLRQYRPPAGAAAARIPLSSLIPSR